ncbi:cobalamin-binding protein [Sulfuriflexus mobilis]|uniref:cobalamin-binding protein n=1 Tax=Sulfuriflexus mobilis TaxID=1811807 RepID=UPI001559421A|nr:cobalamin-binding protein [Sulfuriflexus mobilis]
MATISAQAEPQRIVSLTPHITELLYAIGAERQLIAVVEYSDYPDAAKTLPRIGNVFQLDWERLLDMHPDLVIGWQDSSPQHVLDRIESLGLRLALVRSNKLDSIATQLRQLGDLTGRTVEADAAAENFLQKLAALEKKYSGRRRVRVFYEIDHKPLYTINREEIISDAIRLCGGINIFAELGILAPQVSIESVLQRAPEVLVYSGTSASAEDVFTDWRRWPQLAAVKNGHLYWIEPDLMNRATPRMLQGVEQLCEAVDAAR